MCSSDLLAGRVADLVERNLGPRIDKGLADYLSSNSLIERVLALAEKAAAGAVDERIGAALAEHLESREFAQHVAALTGKSTADLVLTTMSRYTGSTAFSERLAALIQQTAGERIEKAVTSQMGTVQLGDKVARQAEEAALLIVTRRIEESLAQVTESEAFAAKIAEVASGAAVGLSKEIDALRSEVEALRERPAAPAQSGDAAAGAKAVDPFGEIKSIQAALASFEMEITEIAGEIGKLKRQPAPAPAAAAAGVVDPKQVEAVVRKAVSASVAQGIVSSDAFKEDLDERFRILLDYLHSEVIPKEVKKHLGGKPPSVTDTHIT